MGCSNYTTSTCGSFYSNTSAYICKIPPKGCCENFVKNKNTCDNGTSNNTYYESSTYHNVCHSKRPITNSCETSNNYSNSCYENSCNSSCKPNYSNSCYNNQPPYSHQNNCNSNYNPKPCYSNGMQNNCLPPQVNCNEILSNHISLINQAISSYSEADNLLNGEAQKLIANLIALINQIQSLNCQGSNLIDKSKCLLKETNCSIPCCNNLLYSSIEKYDLQKGYLNSVLEALEKASKGIHNASCTGEQGNMYLSQYVDCVNLNQSNNNYTNNCNDNYYNNCNNNCHTYCN